MKLTALFLPCLVVACASPQPSPLDASTDAVAFDAVDATLPDTSIDTSAPDANRSDTAVDAVTDDDAPGSSAALTRDYSAIDCTLIEAVASNDGGIRQNEICDRGRTTPARYATVRDCASALTPDTEQVRRIADEGAYMNPSRHPLRDVECSRFTTIYPEEQVQRAIWCLRHTARCNDDGSPR